MTHAALLPIAILLLSHAMADVMTQSSFDEEDATLEMQANTQQPSVRETRAGMENALDSGYRGIYPVFPKMYPIPGNVNQRSMMPRNIRSQGVPASPFQYYPPPMHNRRRRSVENEAITVSSQRTKRDKEEAATKPTLDEKTLPIVDLPGQKEDKRVNIRQSTLLGLNPASMYPVQHYQYIDPATNNLQDIVDQNAMLMQTNPSPALQIAYPQINLEQLQHALLMQQPYQPQLVAAQYVAAPNPTTSSQVGEPNTQGVHLMPTRSASHDDSEVLGSSNKNVKVKQHMHQHTLIVGPMQEVLREKTVDDDDSSEHYTQPKKEEPIHETESPHYREIAYVPTTQFIILPQSTVGTYPANQGCGYAYTSSYQPIRVCMPSINTGINALYRTI